MKINSVYRLIFFAAASFLLTGCDEFEICGKGSKNNCCEIKTGGRGSASSVNYCVSDCQDCLKSAQSGQIASCPLISSGWYDTDAGAPGCVTAKRKKKTIFGSNDLLHDRQTPIVKVNFSDDPLDCKAVCSDSKSAFCTSAGVNTKLGSQLKDLERKIRQSENGSISMKQLHKMFEIKDTDDPCNRDSIKLTSNSLSNEGPACKLETYLGIGGKDIRVNIDIPESLKGLRNKSGGYLEVSFNSAANAGVVSIADANLQDKYGGFIQNIRVEGNKAYFTTDKSCILLGLE